MSRYRKIEVKTWSDEKFRGLSPLLPSGQSLWFFLLTGPHTGPIPGMFRAGRAAMAEELGWPQEAFDKAFQEAFQLGMVKADFKARFVWLPNAIKHNKPESPNVVKSWGREFDLLPECRLKEEAFEDLKAFIFGLGEAYAKAFREVFTDYLRKASLKTMPNQEQEQEQEYNSLSKGGDDFSNTPPTPEPIQFDDDLPDPDVDSVTGENLKFENQYLTMARTTGIESQYADSDIENIFNLFRCYGPNAKTQRNQSDWLSLWRTWCQREKVRYAKSKTQQTTTGNAQSGNQRPENNVERGMRIAREAAERIAAAGNSNH